MTMADEKRVSILVTGYPQFETQDDTGNGDGISPIPEWQIARSVDPTAVSEVELEPETWNVFARLYGIFYRANTRSLPLIRLHDLTCFVVHRLLSPAASPTSAPILSDCIRCAMILYMLILQGPIYYSHAGILQKMTAQLDAQLQRRVDLQVSSPVDLWLIAVGLVASHGTPYYESFQNRTRHISAFLALEAWKEASELVKSVLWLEAPHTEYVFQSHWDIALGHNCQLVTFGSAQIAPSDISGLSTSVNLIEL